MKCLIIDELLTVESDGYCDSIGNKGLRRECNELSIGVVLQVLGKGSISHSDVTNSWLPETVSSNSRVGTSFHWTYIRSNWPHSWIHIVLKLQWWRDNFLSIDGDGYVVPRNVSFIRVARPSFRITKSCLESRRVTLKKIVLHYSSIHNLSQIEDALCLSKSHIQEVLSYNSDLSVSCDRTARRRNIVDLRWLVVEILYLLWRVSLSFVRDSKGYIARSLNSWRNAKDSVWIKVGSFCEFVSKLASDVLAWFESISKYCDLSASLGRTLSWIYVEHCWWPEIVVRYVIICVLLIVQGDFNVGFIEHEVGWGLAEEFCRANYVSLSLSNTFKLAKGIIWVIDTLINEWLEVSTTDNNSVASCIWTIVWN